MSDCGRFDSIEIIKFFKSGTIKIRALLVHLCTCSVKLTYAGQDKGRVQCWMFDNKKFTLLKVKVGQGDATFVQPTFVRLTFVRPDICLITTFVRPIQKMRHLSNPDQINCPTYIQNEGMGAGVQGETPSQWMRAHLLGWAGQVGLYVFLSLFVVLGHVQVGNFFLVFSLHTHHFQGDTFKSSQRFDHVWRERKEIQMNQSFPLNSLQSYSYQRYW